MRSFMKGKAGVKWVAGCVVMGLAMAFASARALSGLLYGVSAQDQFTYAAAAVVVLVLCALAALGPALSATRTSPMDALRAD